MRSVRRETSGSIFVERALEGLGNRVLVGFDPWQVPNRKWGITREHIGERAHDPRRQILDQPSASLSDNSPCLAQDGVIGPN